MNDQRPRGAQFRGDLVLVHPAAIIGHRRPAEDVIERRVVDQEQEDLAAEIRIAEIIPVVLRRASAVTHEDELGAVDGHGVDHVLGCGHVVGGGFQGARLGAVGNHQVLRRERADPHQRHILHPGAVRITRRQSDGTELLDEIVHRQFLTRRSGCAALEFVRCQYQRLGKQRFCADPRRDRCSGLRRSFRGYGRFIRRELRWFIRCAASAARRHDRYATR